jgi:hypothetical protein
MSHVCSPPRVHNVYRALTAARKALGAQQAKIADKPISREQYLAQMAEQGAFLLARHGVDWAKPGAPVEIEGVFDPNPEIKATGRVDTVKYVPPEEQGAARQREMAQMRAQATGAVDDVVDGAEEEQASAEEGHATPACTPVPGKLCKDKYANFTPGRTPAPVKATPVTQKRLVVGELVEQSLTAVLMRKCAEVKEQDSASALKQPAATASVGAAVGKL